MLAVDEGLTTWISDDVHLFIFRTFCWLSLFDTECWWESIFVHSIFCHLNPLWQPLDGQGVVKINIRTWESFFKASMNLSYLFSVGNWVWFDDNPCPLLMLTSRSPIERWREWYLLLFNYKDLITHALLANYSWLSAGKKLDNQKTTISTKKNNFVIVFRVHVPSCKKPTIFSA